MWLGDLTDDSQWMEQLLSHGKNAYQLEDLFEYVRQHNLENVVVVDNTASKEVAGRYPDFVREGYDIVASNKHANTFELLWYNKLRQQLRNQHRRFYYETNVGAGLPLIDTIRLLHASGDSVHRIRGVFSGSLSFIFNAFSNESIGFSTVLQQAMALGYTEPDPREDLSGKDVARKLLILARELDWQVELNDVEVESLIPPALQGCENREDFLKQHETIDHWFLQKKLRLDEGQVLRYSGELNATGMSLKVKLHAVSRDSELGSLSGSDSIFEIYTEAYGQRPLIIRGAGAGAEVTARGVFSDLLKLASA
jgi:homoserine dehydrogenase